MNKPSDEQVIKTALEAVKTPAYDPWPDLAPRLEAARARARLRPAVIAAAACLCTLALMGAGKVLRSQLFKLDGSAGHGVDEPETSYTMEELLSRSGFVVESSEDLSPGTLRLMTSAQGNLYSFGTPDLSDPALLQKLVSESVTPMLLPSHIPEGYELVRTDANYYLPPQWTNREPDRVWRENGKLYQEFSLPGDCLRYIGGLIQLYRNADGESIHFTVSLCQFWDSLSVHAADSAAAHTRELPGYTQCLLVEDEGRWSGYFAQDIPKTEEGDIFLLGRAEREKIFPSGREYPDEPTVLTSSCLVYEIEGDALTESEILEIMASLE